MDNLLYYPYINIPKIDWTARALLYYDQVGSIVPSQYFSAPENYDPYMRKLVQNELVLPIDPMDVLNNFNEVSHPFIQYINSRSFKPGIRRKYFRQGQSDFLHQSKFGFEGIKIHPNKFDYELFYQLEHAGLAELQKDGWYLVETKTANEMMTFLASVIGEKLEYLPTTDLYKRTIFPIHHSKKNANKIRRIQEKRELILEELIPFPQEINFTKLRSFKETHYDLLKAFRNRVELIAFNHSIEKESPLFAESMRELKLHKEELSARMIEKNFNHIVYGSFCAITSSAIYLATANTTTNMLASSLGFAGAIYAARQIVNPEKIFDQSGMKYLALIDKKLKKYSSKNGWNKVSS